MREVTIAATQMACSWDIDQNVETAERLVRQAADQGAPATPDSRVGSWTN